MTRPVRHLLVAAALCLAATGAAPIAGGAAPKAAGDDTVRLNEVQVIGTHNSYHGLATDAERILLEQSLLTPRLIVRPLEHFSR